ncbi:hypothetical protein [Sphingomonas sp.]|uniref:hypothetical protein n=1 Tax=Sphingomonas sp. TaxID=28214 RepID=UPI0025F14C3A|nr:hypothetical protein [Sphingomonas sp.]MBV9528516.1 hypothetical protein [Sphingomonas sp.]
MADNDTALPEGTDTVIAGASQVDGATGDSDTALLADRETATTTDAGAGGASDASLAERLRSGRDKLSGQAGDRARGLVGQGLERSSEALANVGRMIGDTASGIDDRLGSEYGDYARRAASAIENASNTIASKDPDELIDDARNFVRNSPGIALAGAAVVGFVVARLLRSGIATSGTDESDD